MKIPETRSDICRIWKLDLATVNKWLVKIGVDMRGRRRLTPKEVSQFIDIYGHPSEVEKRLK
ncbi:MAG: hypothetical protein ACI82Q_002402 [Nonlabens sp.]|jgi:hypothetical protein